jgi:hypothetical protein
MNTPERFVVRVDYPLIGESRFFTHAGALSREYPDARQFPTKAKAERVARTLGENAHVEPVEGAK